MTAIAVAALLAVAVAPAAVAGPPLSLWAAQAEARAHAPEGAELDARVRAAQRSAEAASRVLRSNPSLSGTYAPGALAGRPEEQSWDVGLSQTIDVSGSWNPRGASASADRERVAQQREDGLRALDEAVAIALADVAQGQRGVVNAERIAALQQIAADAAHKQLDVGEGNQLDVDGADLVLLAARADAARAHGDLTAARTRLARLLGRETHADITVEDPAEDTRPPAAVSIEALVERSPRVLAAGAELRAAELELAAAERSAWPEVTLGAFYAQSRREIPAGSFQGPGSAGLSASWTDAEVGFRLGFPLPFFERKQSERALASGRLLVAEAQLRRVRADVRQEVESASSALQSAQRAVAELAKTSEIIEREFDLLDQAFRRGSLDAVARAVAVRTLQEAARRYDREVRDLRVARARWIRATRDAR